MTEIPRTEMDRRDAERRASASSAFFGVNKRGSERRNYLDRRTDPNWRQRWLRTRVIAVLRD